MEYNFSELEKNIKSYWQEQQVYKVTEDYNKPKYYVLDMFPYPSGAGLHVGHPLGYIASDIISRYKRMKGYNVLHPMGFDAFGLPAEQYALDTGQHPVTTTKNNIARYKEQLDNIGFDYDWSREINTSEPKYFKWTQWIFSQLFNAWYDRQLQKTRPIQELIDIFKKEGNVNHPAPNGSVETFTDWSFFNEVERRNILMQYRLAYLDYAEVWWCEALNTVLANDEVVNGVSERGGFPVIKKKMRQWFLRITEFADRLLAGLDDLDWSEAMKEMQRNWIGKSQGAEVNFKVKDTDKVIKVFTTRPDTIFGVDFLVIAPEHDLLQDLLQTQESKEVSQYIAYVKSRSERERMAEKKITGVFTGFYATHPITGKDVPVWTSEYVLAGYGTGAIMAVPAGDDRDHAFAQHFNIPITNIFGDKYTGDAACSDKNVSIHNSEFISGLSVTEAQQKILQYLTEKGIGHVKTNYKLRDAGFSRQRYWGEPFPIVYKNQLKQHPEGPFAIPYLIDEPEANLSNTSLPLELPYVEKYGPGIDGQGPLSNIPEFMNVQDRDGEILQRESSTLPGFAGSSWYFLRYADPNNNEVFADRQKVDYWNQVDIYIGGTEHAVGHLLYSRMWTKVLHDLGYISFEEPFKKLLNQGMIQGSSRFVYRLNLNHAMHLVSKTIKQIEGLEYKKLDVNDYFGFDYYFPATNFGIDITRNNILKQRVEKYSEITNPNKPHVAFISECEIFEFYYKGEEVFKTWLSNIIQSANSYQSQPAQHEHYFISKNKVDEKNMELYDLIRVDVNIVDGFVLNVEKFREWREEYRHSAFIMDNNEYICGAEVEKMSKSKYNVVNPDDIVEQYGADTFRMYEMFLGPIELSKPWDTKGIEGVSRFLRKFWRLYFDESGLKVDRQIPAQEKELKVLHKTIKKVVDSTERFSFNTAVSQLMICVNELSDLKTVSGDVLIPLIKLIAPYAPHMAEFIWQSLGEKGSIIHADYPEFIESYTIDNTKVYPVAINGKARAEIEMPIDATQDDMMAEAMKNDKIKSYLEGVEIKKVIYVKGKMLNIVVG